MATNKTTDGYVSSDPNVRAAVKAMSAQADFMSSKNAIKTNGGTLYVNPTNVGQTLQGGGVASNQIFVPNSTSPTTPDTSHAGQYMDPLTGNWLAKDANGSYRGVGGTTEAATPNTISQGGDAPDKVTGYYDNSTGMWVNAGAGQAYTKNKQGGYDLVNRDGSFLDPNKTAEVATSRGTLSSDSARSEAATTTSDLQQTAVTGTSVCDSLKKQYEDAQAREKSNLEQGKAYLEAQQKEETATSGASAYKMGQAGTDYATQAMSKLRATQQYQVDKLQADFNKYMADSQVSLKNGEIALSKEQRAQGEQAFKAAQQLKKDADDHQKALNDVQEADVKEGGVLYSAAKGGTPLSDAALSAHDVLKGYQPGVSKILYKAAQESVNDENEEAADTLASALGKTDVGGTVTLGGHDYIVSGKANGVVNSVEVDKATGENMAVSFDPKTRTTVKTPMGTFPSSWEIRENPIDHSLWRVDPNTQEMQRFGGGGVSSGPLTPGDVQKTNASVFKDGTKGPFLPGHEANAGFCAAATNYWYGEGIMGDSVADKVAAAKRFPAVTADTVESGDTFIMGGGKYGHVGIVGDVYTDMATGKKMFTCTESNYIPGGKGLLSNSRKMSVEDPRIVAMARIPVPNLPPAGGDSPYSSMASGSQNGWLTGSTKTADESKPLSFDELKKINQTLPPEKQLKYGATSADAIGAGATPGASTPTAPGMIDDQTSKELAGMNATNKQFWQNTSSQDRDVARQLINGDLLLDEASSRASSGNPDSERIRLNKLALALDPTFSPAENKRRNQFMVGWNDSKGRASVSRVSANTALLHMAELKKWTDQLQNSDFMKANSIKNAIDVNINNPQTAEAVQNFDYTAELLAHEMAQFYKGTASPTDDDIAAQRKVINSMKPNDIMRSLIKLQSELMGEKVSQLGVEYKKVMQKYPDDPILDPDAIKALRDAGVDTTKLEGIVGKQTNKTGPTMEEIYKTVGGPMGIKPSSSRPSNIPEGYIRISRGGQEGWISPDELDESTDKKL